VTIFERALDGYTKIYHLALKGLVGPFFVTIFPLHPFISPPKAPGFRAEWAPLGPFLLGGGGMGAHEDRGSA